jgi:HEPN domain-containing protein
MWAHQAGEKAIKAVLVAYDIDPPKQHDLDRLALRLPDSVRATFLVVDLSSLTRWAIDGRYPDDFEEASFVHAFEALELARQVLAIAALQIDRLFNER